MPMKHDLTGRRFGRLTALYTVPNNNNRTRWHCVCDCGNTKDVLQQNLCNGHVKSCGCLFAEENARKISTLNSSMEREEHGETKTRLYRIWIGLKSRCFSSSSSSYKDYGGRGISMCDEWKTSYLSFKQWAFSAGYSDNLTIDRIDVNGDYSPSNCRWVSMSVQQFNKRTPSRNTSGVVGVSFNKNMHRWVAYIAKERKTHYLGSFKSFDEAVNARKDAESRLYG